MRQAAEAAEETTRPRRLQPPKLQCLRPCLHCAGKIGKMHFLLLHSVVTCPSHAWPKRLACDGCSALTRLPRLPAVLTRAARVPMFALRLQTSWAAWKQQTHAAALEFCSAVVLCPRIRQRSMNKGIVGAFLGILTPLLVASSAMSIWQYGNDETHTLNETHINDTQIAFMVIGIVVFGGSLFYLKWG
jgi:hypothetical protein